MSVWDVFQICILFIIKFQTSSCVYWSQLHKRNVLLLIYLYSQTDNHIPIFIIGLLDCIGLLLHIKFSSSSKVERLQSFLLILPALHEIYFKIQDNLMYNEIIVTTFGLSVLILEFSICYAHVQKKKFYLLCFVRTLK